MCLLPDTKPWSITSPNSYTKMGSERAREKQMDFHDLDQHSTAMANLMWKQETCTEPESNTRWRQKDQKTTMLPAAEWEGEREGGRERERERERECYKIGHYLTNTLFAINPGLYLHQSPTDWIRGKLSSRYLSFSKVFLKFSFSCVVYSPCFAVLHDVCCSCCLKFICCSVVVCLIDRSVAGDLLLSTLCVCVCVCFLQWWLHYCCCCHLCKPLSVNVVAHVPTLRLLCWCCRYFGR